MSLILEIRSLPATFEARNNLLDEMDQLVAKARTENRALNYVEVRKFNNLKAQVEEMDKELAAEPRFESRQMKSQSQINEEQRMFIDFVRTGESRDLASVNNGSMIPVSVAGQIKDRIYEISPLIREATNYNVSEDLNIPMYDYNNHVTSFLVEFQNIVESSGTFTSIPLKSHIMGTLAKVGKSLVNRADVDVLSFIVNATAKSVAKFLEKEIITNANAMFASTLATGVTQSMTSATTLVIAPEEIVRIKNMIPSMMLPNAKFLMHKNTLSYLQSLKSTTGEFLFGNSLSEGNGNMILGHEVMLSDSVAQIGVGARQIYFGDFKEGLAIKIGSQSAEIYRELYAREYAIGVGHFMEVDVSASHMPQALAVMVGK